ncbi:MAG: hypothetical protein JOY68_00520, partial [Candidatus Dormibacteraeota bacterium]|nr:hypothetical protein [Candidatus Dormibacteraeota bacterium]
MKLFQPRFAVTLTVVALIIFVGTAVAYLTPVTPPQVFREAGDITTLFFILPYSLFALIGGLIAARRPRNPVGWCVLGGALSLAVGASSDLFCSVLTNRGNAAGPWIGLGGVFWASGVSLSTVFFVAAAALFPDGRLLSRRWRALLIAAIVLAALTAAAGFVTPGAGAFGIGYSADPAVNPPSPLALSGAAGFVNVVQQISNFGSFVIEALAIVSVLLRLRGADSDRRHQVRWFATGLVTTIVFTLATSLLPTPNNPAAWEVVAVSLMALIGGTALPACAAVAIFRYRLYDIDVFINRALVYGTLAVFITAVYVAIVVGIGIAIGSGKDPNLGLSILATAIVAIGFQPLRERVQRIANRIVYGKRATPYEVLSELSSTLSTTTEAEDVLPRMARLLRDGTGAERAVVWTLHGRRLQPVGTAPADSAVPAAVLLAGRDVPAIDGMNLTVPVTHQGELLGALSIGGRRGEGFGQGETKLLHDLAVQAGPVLKNTGLTEELLQRLDELSASRRRLVSAQDDERRRLERNLHD